MAFPVPTRHARREGLRAFTLIELLVVIAIIAILAVVVVLTLNPSQLLAQSRDVNRLQDMSSLVSAVNLYAAGMSGASSFSLGNASSVYVSVPDPLATSTAGDACQGLGIQALPSGSYHCASSTFFRGVGGAGWMPIDFSSINSGSPFGSLPIDPVNQTSSHLYYTYATNGSQFEVTAAMESQKYRLGGSGNVVSTDGGILPNTYEAGTNLSLMPLDYGSVSQGIALVQSSTITIDGTSSTCPLISTGVGDFLVVMYRINFQGISGITFSDTKGDSFISDATSSDSYLGVAYAYNIQGGSTAITMSGFASNIISMSCFEYTGIQTSGDPFDGGAVLVGSASSTYGTGPITTTGSSDLILGQLSPDLPSISPTAPFSQLLQIPYAVHGWTTYTVEAVNAPAGSYNSQGSLPTSTSWHANIAAFK